MPIHLVKITWTFVTRCFDPYSSTVSITMETAVCHPTRPAQAGADACLMDFFS